MACLESAQGLFISQSRLHLDLHATSSNTLWFAAYLLYHGHYQGPQGWHTPSPALLPGINVPPVTFFQPETEDLDVTIIQKHALRMAQAGINSFAVQGSNGEAADLSHEERNIVTSTVRSTLDDAGFPHVPIIVRCEAQSVRETVKLCKDAHASGGGYALVLPPPAYTDKVLIDYFRDVAEESPIPILIYNYPTVVSGTDLSSNVIISIAEHPNVVGCKLTCGNTGKLNRVASHTNAATSTTTNSGWMCMGGSADFTLQTPIAGSSGIITGLGNIAPKACVKIFDLYRAGKVEEAQKMQAIVSRADQAIAEEGVVGLKVGLESWFGLGGVGRRPLPKPSSCEVKKYTDMYREVVELEMNL